MKTNYALHIISKEQIQLTQPAIRTT